MTRKPRRCGHGQIHHPLWLKMWRRRLIERPAANPPLQLRILLTHLSCLLQTRSTLPFVLRAQSNLSTHLLYNSIDILAVRPKTVPDALQFRREDRSFQRWSLEIAKSTLYASLRSPQDFYGLCQCTRCELVAWDANRLHQCSRRLACAYHPRDQDAPSPRTTAEARKT